MGNKHQKDYARSFLKKCFIYSSKCNNIVFSGENMIKTTKMLLSEYENYSNANNKIGRLVKEKKLFPIVRGLYETNINAPAQCLAECIYGPSYLSFDYALAYYGLIPEAVYVYTSASYDKRKSKTYENPFGVFTFHDVPKQVYSYGVKIMKENGYFYKMASPEKALCDKLYLLKPIKNLSELKTLLFDDLRIDEFEFSRLNKGDICFLASIYKNSNVKMLYKFIRRVKNE